ncbi:MAG: carboxypeptidase regulatory-like domain-containing protein [Acidobacteriota bacterium]|nr:carboxypeptidase regulatory-like domain-containing protein [Acidobacteriota bacterium]
MRKLKNVILSVLCMTMLVVPAFTQEAAGRFIGTVVDSDGTPLPGVSVAASSPALVGQAATLTDGNGVYRILAVPPGFYTITYSLSGFKTLIREQVQLRPEQSLTLDVSLEMGALEEEVIVVGQSPLIDVRSTARGMDFSKETFQRLPRGRDFQSLALTVAGVNEEPLTGGGLSVDGATGAENVFYIDGMDITEMDQGRKGQEAAFEFIEEVQMKASGYQAEFGGAIGGVLNVITRSGGNDFRGEVLGYYAGSVLESKERDTLRLGTFQDVAEYANFQDLYGKDKSHRLEGGFNLGGFVVRDKLWFFTSVLPVARFTERNVEWATATDVPVTQHSQNYYWYNASLKLTAQPIQGLRLSASVLSNFSKYKGDLPARDGSESPTKNWGDYGFTYPNFSGTLSADYTVGNNFLISGRFGFFSEDMTNQLVQPTEPRYHFRYPTAGTIPYGQLGTNAMFEDIPADMIRPRGWSNMSAADGYVTNSRLKQRVSANLNFTYYINLAGEHAWKAGIQYIRLHQNIDDTYKYPYVLLGWGSNFQDIVTGEITEGQYGMYAVRGGDAGPYGTFANVYSNRWAMFIQDSWTPSFAPRMTFNLGVRVESEDIPSYSDIPEFQYPPIEFGFFDKIAPRLGFVYDVFGNSRTKIFASYGLYYDVMKLEMAIGSFGGFKWKSDYYLMNHWDWRLITKENPGALGPYVGTYDWRLPSFDTLDPDLRPMSQSEFSFGIEQQLGDYLSGSLRLVYKHMIRAIEDVGVVSQAGETYYISNPGFGYTRPESQGGLFSDAYPETPRAQRDYWAANFNFEKRYSNNWMGGFSYTLSRLYGNYDGLGDRPNVGRVWDLWYMVYDKNMNVANGPLTTDRPHQFKLYGSYLLDFGLTLGFFANAMSGVPVSRTLPMPESLMVDGRLSDGRSPFLFLTNFYAEYNIKMSDRATFQFSVNVDNLLDMKTARRKYAGMSRTSIPMTDALKAQGFTYNFDAKTATDAEGRVYSWTPDPRFLMEYDFTPPRAVRLGFKFIF